MSTYLQDFSGTQIVGRKFEGDEALHHIIAETFGGGLAQEFLGNIQSSNSQADSIYCGLQQRQ